MIVYALKELKFHKDNAIRIAATEAARQCERFVDEILPLYEKVCLDIPTYDGQIIKFSPMEKDVENWINTKCKKIKNTTLLETCKASQFVSPWGEKDKMRSGPNIVNPELIPIF